LTCRLVIRDLLSDVGRNIATSSGDDSERVFLLLQRLSVVVQGFNSTLLHSSFLLRISWGIGLMAIYRLIVFVNC